MDENEEPIDDSVVLSYDGKQWRHDPISGLNIWCQKHHLPQPAYTFPETTDVASLCHCTVRVEPTPRLFRARVIGKASAKRAAARKALAAMLGAS